MLTIFAICPAIVTFIAVYCNAIYPLARVIVTLMSVAVLPKPFATEVDITVASWLADACTFGVALVNAFVSSCIPVFATFFRLSRPVSTVSIDSTIFLRSLDADLADDAITTISADTAKRAAARSVAPPADSVIVPASPTSARSNTATVPAPAPIGISAAATASVSCPIPAAAVPA